MSLSMAQQERLMQVLVAPLESEKAARIGNSHRQVVFEVRRDADKQEIKAAVEFLFNVEVASVRVLNVRGKRRNFGRVRGRRSDWKKAYVALKAGYDVAFASGA